jgi:hypothetical protein
MGLAAAVAFVGFATALPAQAGLITVSGNTAASTSQLGNFTGKLSYVPSSSTSAVFTVSLTNTSNPANGGYITGFVFNNPQNDVTGASLKASNTNFVLLGGPGYNNGINGAPFGYFDVGAALGGSYLGGGSPLGGLGVAKGGTFTFTLTGSHLDNLQVADFVSSLSDTKTAGGGGAQFMAVRFRGFINGGSDKVPGMPVVGGPVGGPVPTPEPATLVLGGLGACLACLPGLLRRRRRSQGMVDAG